MVNGEVERPPIGWIKIGLDSYVDPDFPNIVPFRLKVHREVARKRRKPVAPLGDTMLVVQEAAGDLRSVPPAALFPMDRAGGFR